jgi:hypothetical protein
MADKYKLILLGKIAAGYDDEVVHEKLAIIFEIELKKIKKLLKKPLVIRTELNREVALKYKNGLERIGVVCDISPPLESDKDKAPILEDSEQAITDDLDTFSIKEESELQEPKPFVIDGKKFKVINIKLPFFTLVKWTLASIPAILLFRGIFYLIELAIDMLLGNFA